MKPNDIKKLRDAMPGETALGRKTYMSGRLGVSVHTIEEWESGRRKPSPTSLIVLRIIATLAKQGRPLSELDHFQGL
jgi:DNA-binding transcriptional regulator YiaG